MIGCTLFVVGCTPGGTESSIDTTADITVDTGPAPSIAVATTVATPPGFETLPPVPRFDYSADPLAVVAQVASSSAADTTLPLFTLYGDGTVITTGDDGWVTGSLSSLEVQDYLTDAASVGLLDGPLVLRGPAADGRPDIVVEFAVDDQTVEHAIDIVRVDESSGLWRFLLLSATRNQFGFTDTFAPEAWVSCDDESGCALGDSAESNDSRPVLPHEEPAEILAEVAAAVDGSASTE
ncbi:MAG: hypothetical protein AAFY28_02675 [Actinomycetota bacterium]